MKKLLWLIPMIGLLTGCFLTVDTREAAVDNSTGTIKLTGVGYGNMGTFEGYTPGQKRLMAMRASKLDAYRALAEQVHGVRISGNSTVAAMVSQNDSFRVYVDAYLRGAKVVSVTPMAENNYETILELELGNDFFGNLRNHATSQPEPQQNMTSPSLASKSVTGPGSAYSANNFYYSD